jgi:hypothetical protein
MLLSDNEEAEDMSWVVQDNLPLAHSRHVRDYPRAVFNVHIQNIEPINGKNAKQD